jgi:DNA-binding transcriptional regulator GbsR (MarR family)
MPLARRSDLKVAPPGGGRLRSVLSFSNIPFDGGLSFPYFLSWQKYMTITPLSSVQQKFILHWGEMGTRWGINRTVAQIHALLFISHKPLNAEDISGALDVARSNVSNSLKELQGWGIVKRVHVMGDSRDHFESMKDVWEMFRVVLDERKKREIDPTVAMLRECVAEAHKDKETDKYTERKLGELADFFDTTTAWYGQIRQWPTTALTKFVKAGDKIRKLLAIVG